MPIPDRPTTWGCVAAATLWVLTAAFILGGVVTGAVESDLGVAAMSLMATGLALSAAAATATIRQYFVAQNKLIQNFYEIGRDSAGGQVRQMR